MNNYKNNSEKGQAIVYLAIGLVVFLGFVGLSIDGGMALADRRHSQNVADSASLAGGAEAALTLEGAHINYDNWNCNNGTPVHSAIANADNTAISRASANGFSIDTNQADHNGVTAACGSFDYGFFVDRFIDVTVDISATTKSNFAQLLFPAALHNEVDATTRVRPRQPIAFGNALVALSPETCSGNKFGALFLGTGDTVIEGGGIFSNGCVRNNGNSTVNVTGGGIYGHYLDIAKPNDIHPTPETTTFVIPESNYDIALPPRDNAGNCIGAQNVSGDLPAVMTPGLYCVTGGLKLHGTYTGTGVTIIVLDGDISVNAQSVLKLSAPESSPDPSPAIPGLLFYLPTSNPSSVTLNGGSGSFLKGLILAPRSDMTLNGNAADYINGQVIGWSVFVSGTNGFSINYNPNDAYQRPTSIELAK
jgi:Flp pilus assembly protein TadG